MTETPIQDTDSESTEPTDSNGTELINSDGTDSTGSSLAIHAPDRSLPDEEIAVRITGAPPGETVEFEAAMADEDGVIWRSESTFTADSEGTVDLSEHSPDAGSYDGVRPMRWLWSMQADDEDQLVTALMYTEPTVVRLRASAGEQTAERRIERGFDHVDISRTAVETDEFVGTVFEPAGDGPHPGVLVLHGSGGHSPNFRATLLASHGFSAFALQYIGEHGLLPERIVEVDVAYFDTAAEWFRAREAVADESLGLVGHSRGGEIGLWLAAHRDWVGPVVSYVGSSVLWNTPSGDPAWLSENGEPLPFVSGKGKPTLLEGQLDEADATTREAATVPVERLDGPVLFISGEKDPIWPARRLADIALDRLDAAEFEYDYDHLTYDDAGHFITPPFLPKSHHVFGGTPSGMARADADSWPAVLDCLRSGFETESATDR